MNDDPKPRPEAAKASSVPALVTFWLLAIWSGMITGVFLLVAFGVTVSTVMFGLLSGIVGTETTLLVAAVSFWVGSTVGARASGDAISESNKSATDALKQLAGAGPPPPAQPGNGDAPDDPFVIKP